MFEVSASVSYSVSILESAMKYASILPVIVSAADIILSAADPESTIHAKSGDANYVTAYDSAVQKRLIGQLSSLFPDASFFGEEDGQNDLSHLKTGLTFIIDPIDGTTNFMQHYMQSAISVGLCDHGEMVFGAIYNPYLDRLYYAEKGQGAFVRHAGADQPIHVSSRHLADSLCGFGTSPYRREEFGERTFRTAYRLFMRTRDVRRSGSAALDLAAVASGAIDVFFEYCLFPWDHAAGTLLIREAGGTIIQIDGSPVSFEAPCGVIAGNPDICREVLDLSAELFEI